MIALTPTPTTGQAFKSLVGNASHVFESAFLALVVVQYKWQATLVVCLGIVMAILDSTIVSVTLPQMQKAFHTDFATITWVATAYFLAQAAAIPIVGYLSDHIGTKTVFLTSLVLFTLASALCAFAPSKELLILFRVF